MELFEGNQKLLTQALCISFFFALEWVVPYFEQREGKLLHDFRNLIIATLNGVLGSFVFAAIIVSLMQWSVDTQFGLLNWLGLSSGVLRLFIAFLLFDCWMYWWHRINHEVPFLWRFHRMHHTDPAMNVSTGLRFHPIEIVFSFLARLLVIPLIGLTFNELLLYEIVLQVVILFHHSNVFLFHKADDFIRLLFVSPHMHKVHHSELIHETNSNYSSVFSFWDRIFGSYIYRNDVHNIKYGIGAYEEDKWQTLSGMMKIPFK